MKRAVYLLPLALSYTVVQKPYQLGSAKFSLGLFQIYDLAYRQMGYVFRSLSIAIRFPLFGHQRIICFVDRRLAFVIILYFFSLNGILAQGEISAEHRAINSLKQRLALAEDDSSRIMIMDGLGFNYEPINTDSSLKYSYAALALARQKKFAWGEARLLASLTGVLTQQGKFADAFDVVFQSLKIAEYNNLPHATARAYRRLSWIYDELGNYPKAIEYGLRALKVDELNEFWPSAAIDHVSLAGGYYRNNNLDSAHRHLEIAFQQKDMLKNELRWAYEIAGDIEKDRSKYDQALAYYRAGSAISQQISDFRGLTQFNTAISSIYIKRGKLDSAQYYALKGLEYAQQVSFKKGIVLSGTLLSELYDSIQPVLALKYFKLAAGAKDSLYGATHIMTIQNQISREQARQNELEAAQLSYRNRLNLYGLLGGFAVLFIIVFFLYRNNKQKQNANIILGHQKNQLEVTLKELKSTQSQLIQSEKMASLGELTAGIAHEIQNPLNFVNNFSEVSNELIAELKSEKTKGERDEALEDEILNDISQNLEKINHHGKRAADIVKGMLQHSRTSSGQKELTDLNALADEYLRLTYHGFRAKDKSFTADFKDDLDPSLPKVSVIPQDIARVLLNLINNAFYAVSEKSKKGISGYLPTVTLKTKKRDNLIEIRVKDNADGIPDGIVNKIFQPFFTTKPTGQGTGLGLSLSYDIITKGHNGTLEVDTTEGVGSEFIIQLPIV